VNAETSTTTIGALLAAARRRLPDSAHELRQLLAHALGRRSGLDLLAEEAVSERPQRRFDRGIERLAAGEPLQYILGEWDFYGRTFRVDPRALIPRPETEHVVEQALDAVAAIRSVRALDLGCGSGILAVTLAKELPSCRVVALDASLEALALARENVRAHGVGERVALAASDWLDALAPARFDLAVGNPPYVAAGDRESLPPAVRDHEPPRALFGGDDGLSEIRRLLAELPAHMKENAPFVFEIGFGQRVAVTGLVGRSGAWRLERFAEDLAGIPRVCVVRRSEAR
jgi:release factor glutamine methyltransferase